MADLPITIQEFKSRENISLENICRNIVTNNQKRIKIKKEHLAVQNMLRITNAVITLSQKKGFHAMSLRDLSHETGLSMGALYNYFSSKEELLQMIYEQGKISVFQIMESNAIDENPEQKLHQAICSHLYLSEILPKIFSFFFMEAKNLPLQNQKDMISLEQLTEKFFENILQEGIDKKAFSLADIQLTASAIKALLQDWYLKRYKFSSRKLTVEQYAQFVIGFISNNLH